jgi:hypothetical protein
VPGNPDQFSGLERWGSPVIVTNASTTVERILLPLAHGRRLQTAIARDSDAIRH